MQRLSITQRTFLQFVAVAIIATVRPTSAVAEDRLQLRVPQTFTDEPTIADLHEYTAIGDDASTTVDEVEVVRERYANGKVRVERQVTLDADGNYVNHGTWKLFSANETVIAEGQYDMGRRVGSWTRWYGRNDSPLFSQFPFNRFKPPFASQAIFADGVMDGEWLIVDSDQRKIMQISLMGGKRNGSVITWLPNGKTHRQANYDQGVPVGDVLEADAKTGELKRVATYIEGRKIVTKTAHHRRGKQKKSEEMFLAATTVEKTPDSFWNLQLAEYTPEGKDLRHGPSKSWFENGQLQVEGFYQLDKRSGTFTYWYANGQVAATGEYSDDLPTDVWVWWHENGQKAAIGRYHNGTLIGEWRWWGDDGKLAEKKVYDGSEVISATPQEVMELGRGPETSKIVK
jgi:antitoxin component YwqK of YwqJK toxin-antitoxin module